MDYSLRALRVRYPNVNQWSADANIAVLTGTKEEHADIIASRLTPQDFKACITGYEI
jgi:SWI/SNF-related matrix-associated actin-dependent regulator of chromatin subfamily A member 5